MSEYFYDCPQCGNAGPLGELSDHPTRPMPMDIGFCPQCGGEIEEILDKAEYDKRMAEYE